MLRLHFYENRVGRSQEGEVDVRLHDATGRAVRSTIQPVQGRELHVDLFGIASGQYILEVLTPDRMLRMPLIKE